MAAGTGEHAGSITDLVAALPRRYPGQQQMEISVRTGSLSGAPADDIIPAKTGMTAP
ncbi:MAG TPA: hypothetical protein VE733_01035 [Streptosporangiaceae bacterium]|nr:hypothetical protein [Streptosporangiaceae bacterium]